MSRFAKTFGILALLALFSFSVFAADYVSYYSPTGNIIFNLTGGNASINGNFFCLENGAHCPSGVTDTNETTRVGNIIGTNCTAFGDYTLAEFYPNGTGICTPDAAGGGSFDFNFSNGTSTGVITDSDVFSLLGGRNTSINCTGTSCTFNAVDTDTDTSANTECAGTTTYLDGEGGCDTLDNLTDFNDDLGHVEESTTNGSGLTLVGFQLNHTDTSSVSDSDNSGRTFIQDLTFDTFGHVLTVVTATWNLLDDTTPQLGGILDTNGNNISMDTNVNISFGGCAIWYNGSGVCTCSC